jgi:hypothetical protein
MNQRIDPKRGPLLAAGGVLLAAAITMLDIRFNGRWGSGVLLIVELAALALTLGIAWRSPLSDRPLGYQTTLAVAGLVVLLVGLLRLADVLGVDDVNTGTLIWVSAIFTLVAAAAALRFASVTCAILAGLGVALFVVSVIDKIFDPSGPQTFRWIFFLLALAFGAAAWSMRDSERSGFAVAAVDVAGVLMIALATTFALTQFASVFNPLSSGGGGGGAPGFGWKIILIVGSLAVIAYGAVSRERGPGFVGTTALAFAIFLIAEPGGDESIVGWPLVLLLAAGAALFAGLRPAGGNGGGGGPAVAAAGTPGPPGGGAAVAPPATPGAGAPPAPPAPGTREQPPGA